MTDGSKLRFCEDGEEETDGGAGRVYKSRLVGGNGGNEFEEKPHFLETIYINAAKRERWGPLIDRIGSTKEYAESDNQGKSDDKQYDTLDVANVCITRVDVSINEGFVYGLQFFGN